MEKIYVKLLDTDKVNAQRSARFRKWVRLEQIRARPYCADEVPGIALHCGA